MNDRTLRIIIWTAFCLWAALIAIGMVMVAHAQTTLAPALIREVHPAASPTPVLRSIGCGVDNNGTTWCTMCPSDGGTCHIVKAEPPDLHAMQAEQLKHIEHVDRQTMLRERAKAVANGPAKAR